jgi:uncharacterized radical SAM superfamily protein
MGWIDRARALEAYEDTVFDASLVASYQTASVARRPIRFYTPTFRAFDSCELKGCGKNSFPAFSITSGGCALQCDHCRAKILEPMIPATTPTMLEKTVDELVATQDLKGFLLSGGSNRRNEVAYERFYPAVERIKRQYPHLQVAMHTALLDRARARAMASAGTDVAMMDVIGAQETIDQVYHLDRPVADFEATLAALCETSMAVVPHIVIGLHYGQLRGEWTALEIVARYSRVSALVLVVVMPFYAAAETPFRTVPPDEIGQIFLAARQHIANRPVLLGCARPAGIHKRMTDAYAVMAGLDGIAFPADGAVELANLLGRPMEQHHACCSMIVNGADDAQFAAGSRTFLAAAS